jgi:hypothetical protein
MDLERVFEHYGIGVLATSGADGNVNTAVYATPHFIDAKTLAWGMTDGLTFRNVSENPNASYLFKNSAPGFNGARVSLKKLRSEEEGELLTVIKRHTDQVVGPGAGDTVTHAVIFEVTEIRPLF